MNSNLNPNLHKAKTNKNVQIVNLNLSFMADLIFI